jgi:hypothetical protein
VDALREHRRHLLLLAASREVHALVNNALVSGAGITVVALAVKQAAVCNGLVVAAVHAEIEKAQIHGARVVVEATRVVQAAAHLGQELAVVVTRVTDVIGAGAQVTAVRV